MTRAISASLAGSASASLRPPSQAPPATGASSSVTGGIAELLFECRMDMPGAGGGIGAGGAAEHGADDHADAGGVALAEQNAGHQLPGGKQVGARPPVEAAGCRGIGLHAEIGEGDAGLERI